MSGRVRAFVGVLALALVACGGDETETAIQAPPVMAERVGGHRVAERIQATGQLLAVDEASVAAEVSGRITALLVTEGAPVEAGDVVLEIDRERRELELANERALVAGAREEIGQARRELGRIRNLRKSQAASQAQLDAAETALRSAEARHAAAEAKLGLAEIALRNASVTAPFSGLVARRFVSIGDHVSVAEPLFDLVALDPIEVEFHLTERDSARAQVGETVRVRVAPYPDEVFPARVHVVSPRIDPVTRTLRVKARVENEERKLRPGLFARAELGVAVREGVPMVPEEAVLQRSDGSVVFVLEDGNLARRRRVALGVFHDGLVEVTDGLEVGSTVIVRGMDRLIDGSRVDLRNADGTPADEPHLAGGAEPSRALP